MSLNTPPQRPQQLPKISSYPELTGSSLETLMECEQQDEGDFLLDSDHQKESELCVKMTKLTWF